MNELHLFAGAGGGILGGQLLGHTAICAVELEKHPRQVLLQRQRDGVLPKFPIWDDVCTFDGKPWRGTVDVVCGGFPCQDISSAGKGAGIAGERSGLWKEYARIVDEVRPRYVFAENSPLLRGRGLDIILKDLSELGYDARWCVLGAWHVGAPHKRNRMWVLAEARSNSKSTRAQLDKRGIRGLPERCGEGAQGLGRALANSNDSRQHPTKGEGEAGNNTRGSGSPLANSKPLRLQRIRKHGEAQRQTRLCSGEGRNQEKYIPEAPRSTYWEAEPRLGRVANGVANRVDRIKAIGNGQVPAVAAAAWNILNQQVTNKLK